MAPFTGGVVIDIGTGDGQFVSASARRNPDKFFIGIDVNVKPLEKPSMKATRKPSKGGLPNALFLHAAVEALPEELDGIAKRIHINFPWGGLLKAVATGDIAVLRSLRRVSAPDCLLNIVIGIDPDRDRSEIARLGLPDLSDGLIRSQLLPRFRGAGFDCIEHGELANDEWRSLTTSWAKKLQAGRRIVTRLIFRATSA